MTTATLDIPLPGLTAQPHPSEGGRWCVSEDEWKQMQKEIRSIVRAAVKFADDAAEPSVEEELYSDVYANPVPNLSPSGDYVHGAKNPLL
ncbi:hypothetical protein JYU07_00230 [Roseiflexus sp. AH-315-K22]|nr:hypothetical protein [Roseiflexus sp. AH-315-K22]